LSLSDNAGLAAECEAAGVDGVWVSEYVDRDAVTQLAQCAQATSHLTVGSSAMPIYIRSATVIGMSAMSLAELAPGRLRIGLGASTDVIVSGWHGLPRPRPLAAMRDYVDVVRAVASGGRVDHNGRVVTTHGFRYATPGLSGSFLIDVAALGPKMCRLAGEVADGVLLNLVTAGDLPRVRALVDDAASGAGRRTSPPLITDVRMGVVGRQNREDVTAILRRLIASYGRVPAYNAHYARSGFATQAAALTMAWGGSDAAAALEAVDDSMLHALTAIGTPNEIVEHFVALANAGLDEAILYPTSSGEDEMTSVLDAIEVAAAVVDRLRS
jgi:probable F420-dependent oxidoreductase